MTGRLKPNSESVDVVMLLWNGALSKTKQNSWQNIKPQIYHYEYFHSPMLSDLTIDPFFSKTVLNGMMFT